MNLLREYIRELLSESTEYDDKFKPLMDSGYDGIKQAMELADQLGISSQELPWELKHVDEFLDKTPDPILDAQEVTGWSMEEYMAGGQREYEDYERSVGVRESVALYEQKTLAMGMCFPFAYKKAEEWFDTHFTKGKPGRAPKRHPDLNNKDKFKIIHGTVTDKWKKPLKPVVHGWVEMGDMVFDDQSKIMKPDGVPKDVYYDMYQPVPSKEFTAEEAVFNCIKYGGEGPWDEELWAQMQERDEWMNEAGELGRQVFADRAPDGRHHGTERDTELEEEIWTALWGHLQGVSRKVPQNLLDAMVSFSKDPAYNDVFMLYEGGTAFRGLQVTPEYLDENAPGWKEVKFPEGKGQYKWSDVIPTDFEYQSRDASNTTSSWTPSEDVAKNFGRGGDQKVAVVLIADSATNTFLDLKELYNFHRLDDFGWEEEIVGFGPVRVKGIKVGKKDPWIKVGGKTR